MSILKRIGKHGDLSYLVSYRDNQGKRHAETTYNKRDAVLLQAKRLSERREGRLAPDASRLTFEQICQGLRDDYGINHRRSVASIELSIRHLSQTFGGCKAQAITASKAIAYTTARLQEGARPASVNRELSCLKRMFHLAMRTNLLPSMPHIGLLKEDNTRQNFITPGDFVALHSCLPDYLKGPIKFLFLSGWRVGEMRSLEWRDVDLGHDMIRLRPEHSKNGKARLLPLHGDLLAVIKQAHSEARLDCPYVFQHRGQPIGDFRKAWQSTCRMVGLGGLLVHDLRRSFIRNSIRAGVGESVVMAMSGHLTRSVFARYNIVVEQDLIDASAKLQDHLDQSTGRSVVSLGEVTRG